MKYYLLCFAVGVLLGLFLGLGYGTMVFSDHPLPVPASTPKELTKEVVRFEKGYSIAFDTLKKAGDKLQADLVTTKWQLQKVKVHNDRLQRQVYELVDRRLERKQSDTSMATAPDTLATAIVELMQASGQKDSLYESLTVNLEEQVAIKDTTIALKNAQYRDLKTSFEKSLESQQLLTDQNQQLINQYKKQKVKGKVLSALLLTLSGAAATYFLHH